MQIEHKNIETFTQCDAALRIKNKIKKKTPNI